MPVSISATNSRWHYWIELYLMRLEVLLIMACGADVKELFCLCYFKIGEKVRHRVRQWIPQTYTQIVAMHSFALEIQLLFRSMCLTSQYARTFIAACVSLWDMLPEDDFAGDSLNWCLQCFNPVLTQAVGCTTFLFVSILYFLLFF